MYLTSMSMIYAWINLEMGRFASEVTWPYGAISITLLLLLWRCVQVDVAEDAFGTHSIASPTAAATAQDADEQAAGSAAERKPQALS